MKKQAMIASLMALALLVSPIGSLGTMSRVNAEEEPETVVRSVADNVTGAGETTEKVQLDTPTNLRWGYEGQHTVDNGKYCMNWDGVNESIEDGGYYVYAEWRIEVCKDGQLLDSAAAILADYAYESYWDSEVQKLILTDNPVTKHYLNHLSSVIMESGNYKFRVHAAAAYDDESYRDSEWSEWSENISYVRPDQELGVVTNVYWDEKETGVCHFIPLEDSQYLRSYNVMVYPDGNPSEWNFRYVFPDECQNLAVVDVDFSDTISRYGEGKYYVTVQALSNDIDVVANGKEGPKSDILDTTVNAEKLSGILDSAADKSVTETVELLTDSATLSSIQQAMQTSDSFREQVKDLEGRYATEQNITVEAPAVSDTAREYVDPGKVSLVGAAFNAAQGQEVGLQMDVTPAENRVPTYSGYKKNVQLDIKLVSGNTEIHDLAMPISVTMPVPQGINASQLVILHYHADGTTEKAAFHVNGDGTITFTVTSFSTFVFAEESSADTSGDKPGSTPSQNASGNSGRTAARDNLESQIASAAPGATVKVTKDQNINALSNSIMQMLVKRGDVTLDMEYTYEGADYHVMIPAGGAVDNDIAWYGPLYLSAYFSAANPVVGNVENGSAYIVQRGDTLGKIARSYHTTVAQLMTANPQIKNANRIKPGQVINIK